MYTVLTVYYSQLEPLNEQICYSAQIEESIGEQEGRLFSKFVDLFRVDRPVFLQVEEDGEGWVIAVKDVFLSLNLVMKCLRL
jgi:hypothetical protein